MFGWIAGFKRRSKLHYELWAALFDGDAPSVSRLIALGADIEAAFQSNEPDPPLLYACYAGKVDIVRILIRAGANVDGTGMNRVTPLMAAVNSGNLAIVRLLLDSGADTHLVHSNGKVAAGYLAFCPDEVVRSIIRELLLGNNPRAAHR